MRIPCLLRGCTETWSGHGGRSDLGNGLLNHHIIRSCRCASPPHLESVLLLAHMIIQIQRCSWNRDVLPALFVPLQANEQGKLEVLLSSSDCSIKPGRFWS